MTLHHRLIGWLVVVHLGFGGLILMLIRERPWWTLGLEVLLLLSLAGSIRLARRVLAPSRMLAEATDLLEAADFTTLLRPTGNREVDGIIEIYNRMARQLREERVRAAEQDHLLADIERVSPVAMIVLDHDRRVARCNPAARQLLGIDPALAMGARIEEIHPELGPRIAAASDRETELVHLDGRRRLRVRRVHFVDRGFARDVFLIDELTEELRRTEKAAYGKLIRMIAHEVNNTSGAVGSLLESCGVYGARLDPNDRGDFESALEVARRRIDHMNQFMQSFADVVRIGAPAPRPVDLARMLEDLHRLLRRDLEERGIRWTLTALAHDAVIRADPVQLEQALLNILRNAIQAMPQGGDLEVALSQPASRTRLEIFDDGEGIDEEKAGQLFTPFFTTRPDGQGIGLTVVQEILLAHRCEFSLGPFEGRTRFRIDFPRENRRAVDVDL